MPIEVQELGEAAVVRPGDELDLLGYERLAARVGSLLHRGTTRIVLDLGRTSYVNSFGVRIMATMQARAKAAGGGLVLAQVGGGARVALDAAGALKAMQVFKTTEDALSALGVK
jgi:anti-anti-sigma factor